MNHSIIHAAQNGLYNPEYEHDACGVGFVCNSRGEKTHEIIGQGLEVLKKLAHRGATGSDPLTGDGSGILIQTPHEFFKKESEKEGFELPKAGEYAVAFIFYPNKKVDKDTCEKIIAKACEEKGFMIIGGRRVPVDNSVIGPVAREEEPIMEQLFIAPSEKLKSRELEARLYALRRKIEKTVDESGISQKDWFYITHLSSKVVVYKGLPLPERLELYYKDLQDPCMKSSLALVHSRYSTNTFPSWKLAQPFRYLAHNGEINTLRGNVNLLKARQTRMESEKLKDLDDILPVIVEGGSDSAMLDNALEVLHQAGRSMEHCMSMMVPDSWNKMNPLGWDVRAFYNYHAHFMEPWDGPAALAYTNGDVIGAMLDRNGLRPARYVITKDGFVVMASEVGVIDIPPDKVKMKGRLMPGKILLIDTKTGEIRFDQEIKKELASRAPYGRWVDANSKQLKTIEKGRTPGKISGDALFRLQKNFGYTREELDMILAPMAENCKEPVGSMGNDVPLAVFSGKKPLLYNYFKQLFAQVTNPAIDSIREKLVMTLVSYIGCQKNILEESPRHSDMIRLESPILTDRQLAKLRDIDLKGYESVVINATFRASGGRESLNQSLETINKKADKAVRSGVNIIILSDRNVDAKNASVPMLLAASSLHQYLVREGLRSQASIIVETGEAREVMHFALLIGFGVSAINPYLAFATLKDLREKEFTNAGLKDKELVKNYVKAADKGLLKVMSKMGISTIRSYCGSQIFEAIGLDADFVGKYFTGTTSRIGGIGLDEITSQTVQRHQQAYSGVAGPKLLEYGGQYHARRDGERHRWDPKAITSLQQAVRNNDWKKYLEFSETINNQDRETFTLRGLLDFKKSETVPIEEVVGEEEIVKRFVTGAMSFGSISREAHETMAIAMNRLGGKSNSGEGGEDPQRFVKLPNGDSKRSEIKQVASGRFGVTAHYLVNCGELQIKIAQGAKPGEGGQLPGHKVNEEIAAVRHSTPGVSLISPPPHHDIYSIEDLAQLIFDLKNVNPQGRVSVKLVSEIGVGTIAAGVAKGKADMILISGYDGGTGASPLSSIKHAGMPWELGLAETQQTLVANNLRGGVRLQTDGQLRTGRDVAVAALLGAEEYGFATAALVCMGCVMMRKCHVNTCPVGIATQDQILRKRFAGKPEHLVNYFTFIARELRQIMASLGLRTIEEMAGRTDLLEIKEAQEHWLKYGIDLSKILYRPRQGGDVATHCTAKEYYKVGGILDELLIKKSAKALEKAETVEFNIQINNTDRTTGAMLSGEVAKRYGKEGMADDTIKVNFTGSAGQSFGAFLAAGVKFVLEGEANDYLGKGLSGGTIVVKKPAESDFTAADSVIAGNVLLYGATGGWVFINGIVGERFCIRNSGAYAVVEGVGEHGCEYMTGGRTVILGQTGRNFAAGMTGGIAYVLDESGEFEYYCNTETVELEEPDLDDIALIHEMVKRHVDETGSSLGAGILGDFGNMKKKFVKVMPVEYKRVLESRGELAVKKRRLMEDGTS